MTKLIHREGFKAKGFNVSGIQTINGTISTSSDVRICRSSSLRLHRITAKQTLVSGSETWTMTRKEIKRFEAQQAAFLRSLAALWFTDHARNEIIT
jgi:hypothetical protein